MTQYIDKDAVITEIDRRNEEITQSISLGNKKIQKSGGNRKAELVRFLSFINTLEVKDVDLDLITGWFDHIAQIADDRMTLTKQKMTDAHALDEIKCLAMDSSEFITKYYKARKGE